MPTKLPPIVLMAHGMGGQKVSMLVVLMLGVCLYRLMTVLVPRSVLPVFRRLVLTWLYFLDSEALKRRCPRYA